MRQKTLIVIPASGGIEYTSLAVESIRRNTRDIVIALIETDPSVRWEESHDLLVVRPPRFVSFSDSVNRGLEMAGEIGAEYAVVLNNDTAVGRGWLPPLLAALDEGYCVSGPVTNSCGHDAQVAHPPFECVSPQDMNHALVDKFVATLPRKRVPAFAVVGMCMAFRVDLLDQIGEFDRRFLVGNFEDNDWCLRATEHNDKGCCVCAESFVWHFGSATFQRSGQFGEAMESNRIRFERKWLGKGNTPRRYGSSLWRTDRVPIKLTPSNAFRLHEVCDEMRRRGVVVRADGVDVCVSDAPDHGGDDFYEFCDAVELSTIRASADSQSAEKPDISVCMIVKDEEAVLGRCLDSVLPLARQLVVVDTGSTDTTVAIAKQRGAEVYHHVPVEAFDFSAARNYSLGKAECKWILVIDADECLLPEGVDSIRDTVELGQNAAYMIATRLYYDDPKIEGIVPNDGTHPDTDKYCGFVVSTKARLWLRANNLRFRNEVHETVEQSAMEAGVPLMSCDAIVHHFGGRRLEEKDEFYADLGYEKIRSDPCQRTYRELGLQLYRMDRLDECVGVLLKALEFGSDDIECVVLLADSFAKLAKRSGRGDDELKKAESYYLDALKADRDSGLANRHYATFLNQHGRYKEAYWHYRKVAHAATKGGDAKTLCEFAFVCQHLDQPEEAIGLLETAMKVNQQYVAGTGLLECAYQRFGVQIGRSGDMTKAVELFRKALEIRPDFPEAKHNLDVAEKWLVVDTPS